MGDKKHLNGKAVNGAHDLDKEDNLVPKRGLFGQKKPDAQQTKQESDHQKLKQLREEVRTAYSDLWQTKFAELAKQSDKSLGELAKNNALRVK